MWRLLTGKKHIFWKLGEYFVLQNKSKHNSIFPHSNSSFPWNFIRLFYNDPLKARPSVIVERGHWSGSCYGAKPSKSMVLAVPCSLM